MKKTLFISAGDLSGDIAGSRLAAAFIKNGWDVCGVGGDNLKNAGVNLLKNIVSKSTIGFIEPVKNIPYFLNLLGEIKHFTKETRPDAAVVIDFWGFHSLLIKALWRQKIPVFYYISPQIWASRFGRIKKIKKLVKKVFVIYPFEEKIYRDAGVPAQFLGNPIAGAIPEARYNPDSMDIGILPGSRSGELKKHLPLLIKLTDGMKKISSFRYKCFKPPGTDKNLYKNVPVDWEIVEESDYSNRKNLKFAISASGTATLENALLGIPMVIIYKTSALSYALGKKIVKTKFIGLPNILSEKLIAPEFIQADATTEKILPVIKDLLRKDKLLAASRALLQIRASLQRRGIEENIFKTISGNETTIGKTKQNSVKGIST